MAPEEGMHVEERWRVAATAQYLCGRHHRVVAFQFPDDMLPDAATVSTAVAAACAAKGHAIEPYVLGDTTYNSLAVDEVAAAHVDADCVVHYGRASMTPPSRIPAYFVFPVASLDAAAAARALAGSALAAAAAAARQPLLVFVDQPYLDQLPELRAELDRLVAAAGGPAVALADVRGRRLEPATARRCCAAEAGPAAGGAGRGSCCPADAAEGGAAASGPRASLPEQPTAAGDEQECMAGYSWVLPAGAASSADCAFAWVGAADAPALEQLQLSFSACPWLAYDPQGGRLVEGVGQEVLRTLRRRYYLVEKARNASIVGIVAGTLGAAGYREALRSVRSAAHRAGKKTYTLLVGKPSPAKLANFPEIEVFVLVADPQGQVLDCRDYLAPIITPHEALLAFDPGSDWDPAAYRLDLSVAAERPRHAAASAAAGAGPRVSLVGGAHLARDSGAASGDQPAASSSPAAAREADVAGHEAAALAVHTQAALHVAAAPGGRSDLIAPRSAAEYLVHKRSWKGVEAPLAGAEPKAPAPATEGRAGRAAGYADEPAQEHGRPG